MIANDERDNLIRAAVDVRKNAYAPYSNYAVGAAILVEHGRIFTGVNVENASYGLTICAERTAVYKAVSEGFQKVRAIAIATENGGSPCGACRQVLTEFAGDIPVWLVGDDGDGREATLHSLLPDHFGPEHLRG